MYGLVKLADTQNINLNHNYNNREERLLDQYEDALQKSDDLNGKRNPEVESEAKRLLSRGLLGGAGIGAGIGAVGLGASAGKGFRLPAAGVGAIAGGALGLVPGGIVGSVKGENYRQNNEDPQLLKDISSADINMYRAQEQLERHYLMGERLKREEQERIDRRNELMGRTR